MSGPTKTDRWLQLLQRDGYCIIPDLVSPMSLQRLEKDLEPAFEQTRPGRGDFYGYRTKRVGALLRRSSIAAELVLNPTIRALVDAILKPHCDTIQLNAAQAIEVQPGEIEQFPHSDQDMWAGIKGVHEYLVNVMWPLTGFTTANGATRIYPGTHIDPPHSPEDLGEPAVAECAPGAAICFLGSTVHGAGANTTRAARRGVLVGYSLGWLKPYENLWLAYPPEVARTFSRDLAELAGYVQHRPNLGNVGGQCPSLLLDEDATDYPRATDALRPDQADAVRAFARSRKPLE